MPLLRQLLLDSPAGLWMLDEASGTTATDLSGNGRHGTISGGVTLAATGPAGLRAMTFNGSSGQILIGDFAAFSAASFTAEAWVNPATDHNGKIITKSGNTGEWELDVTTSEEYEALLGNTAAGVYRNLTTTGQTTVGRWAHVAMESTSALTTFYVNGVAVATSTATSGTMFTDTTEAVYIGRREYTGGGGPQYFNGSIAAVAYYGAVIGANRIRAHYEAGARSGVVVG